jgi:hypothetical protein
VFSEVAIVHLNYDGKTLTAPFFFAGRMNRKNPRDVMLNITIQSLNKWKKEFFGSFK